MRIRLPKAQPKILDGGRRLSQAKTANVSPTVIQSKTPPSSTGRFLRTSNEPVKESSPQVTVIVKESPNPTTRSILKDCGTLSFGRPQPETVKAEKPNNTVSEEISKSSQKNNDVELEQVPVIEDVLSEVIVEEISTSSAVNEVPSTANPDQETNSVKENQPKDKAKRRHRSRHKLPQLRENMKLLDYIFYNPVDNPMPKPVDKPEETRAIAPTEEEETVDNPDGNFEAGESNSQGADDEEFILPGPRVMIGQDGQITIDETSLVIERTRPEVDISQKEVVYETSCTTYKSFRKKSKVTNKYWTDRETARFYKVLSVVGTDFTLMENMFPEKTRADLKNKYKREERLNQPLIDKALSEWQHFDLDDIDEYLKDGADSEERPKEKEKGKRGRGKSTKRSSQPKNAKGTDIDGENTDITKTKKKRRTSKKRHKNPVWDDDTEEEFEIESDDTPCEQCAIQAHATKRQRALGNKRRIRTCEHHSLNECQESDANITISNGDQISTNRSRKREIDVGVLQQVPRPQRNNPTSILTSNTIEHNASDATVMNLSPKTIPELNSSRSTVIKISPSSQMDSEPIKLLSGTRTSVIPIKASPSMGKNIPPAIPKSLPSSSEATASVVHTSAIQSPPVTLTGTSETPLLAVQSRIHSLAGVSPGQLVVVASKTPNSNQQVLHLYLVSPPNSSQPASTSSADPHGTLRTLLASPLNCTAIKALVPCTAHAHGCSSKTPQVTSGSDSDTAGFSRQIRTEEGTKSVRSELQEAIRASDMLLFGSSSKSNIDKEST